MDKQYLDEIRYSWDIDPKHLKIDGLMPDSRCLVCGRIFLNAEKAIVFCKVCDKAMSICKDGSDHDFDTWGVKIKVRDPTKADLPKEEQIKTINLIARREIRTPIEFNEEGKYFNKNNKGPEEEPHFVTAAGKIIPTTEDPDSDLYRMEIEK